MPAVTTGPFVELFSNILSKKTDDIKTIAGQGEYGDVKISTTSLFSLLGLTEDGDVRHGGMICILMIDVPCCFVSLSFPISQRINSYFVSLET